MSSEKFCLRWNDFERSISGAFKELRDDKDFFDVTIACDDEQIEAHKVILSACSPFFRNIFRRNHHQHPLLYLKGVKFTDMQSVLNFMYHGEVNVAQEELNSFLAVAEDLRVKGLTQGKSTEQSTKKPYHPPPIPLSHKPAPTRSDRIPFYPQKDIQLPPQQNNLSLKNNIVVFDEAEIQEMTQIKPEPDLPPIPQQMTHSLVHQDTYPSSQPPANLPSLLPPSLPPISTIQDSLALQEETYDEYEEFEDTNSYPTAVVPENVEGLQPSDLLQYTTKDPHSGKHVCTLCSNFSHNSQANVRNHIESKHFPGTFVYTCQLCGKQSPSHQGLLKHKSKWHKSK